MAFQGFLRQSTAVDILLGPFLDDTDGKTAETGLTITQGDVKLSKNGQALAQKNDANAAVHDANGYHNCPLDTTDTNTVGQLTLICHESGALPVRLDYHVVEEAVYDAMYAASAAGPLQSTTAGRTLDVNANGEAGLDLDNTSGTIDAAQLGGDCITSAKIADDAISSEHLATGALTADAFAADALVAATFATGAFTADVFAADALAAATFAANSLDGKGDWNTGKTGYTLTNLSDANAAKLEDILDGTGGTGLTLNKLTINGNDAAGVVDIDNAGGAGVVVNGSTLGINIDGASGHGVAIAGTLAGISVSGVTHGLDIDASGGIGVQVTGTTHAVDIAASAGPGIEVNGTTYGIQVTASAGVGLDVIGSTVGLQVDGQVNAGVSITGATIGIDVDGSDGPGIECTGTTYGIDIDASAGSGVRVVGTVNDILADITGNLSGSVGTLSGLAAASAGKLDDILDGTGGTGLTLNKLTINGNDAAGVVDIDNAGGTGISVNGSTLGINIDGAGGHGVAITGALAGVDINGATYGIDIDASAGSGIRVVGTVNDILADITGTIATCTTNTDMLTAAAVNAEVVDALNVDTYAEPSSAPAATASMVSMVHWMFTLARNEQNRTSSQASLRNDADDDNIATASLADDGTTFTRGEWS